MKCRICGIEGSSIFCDRHKKAYENIIKKYEIWKTTLNVSWKEYLSEIAKNPLTGEWARQVSEYLTGCEGKKQ